MLEKALDCTATEENRTRIKDMGYPVYPTSPKQPPSSAAHMKSLFEVANRELDKIAMEFRYLEFQNKRRQRRPLAQYRSHFSPPDRVQP